MNLIELGKVERAIGSFSQKPFACSNPSVFDTLGLLWQFGSGLGFTANLYNH